MLCLEHSFGGAYNWTLRKVDQKYVDNFEMWCWRGVEEIGLTDRVRNEVASHTATKAKLHTIQKTAN
jgi:hypothetical protein